MLARLIALHSRHFRHFSTPTPFYPLCPKFISSPHFTPRFFSTNQNGNNNNNGKPISDFWKMGQEHTHFDDIFDTRDGVLKDAGKDCDARFAEQESWDVSGSAGQGDGGLFEEFGGEETGTGGGVADLEAWKADEEVKLEELYDIGGGGGGGGGGGKDGGVDKESEMVTEAKKLELLKEERALLDVLQGPNRAFGDLVAQSGITDEMLDSLIALKNFQDIEGLPPLTQIEDERYESTTRKSSRYEMELQKQEEAAKARVRQVDENGRAYGTGKRKCSIARVWIQPGEGKFLINDKEYDVYFPMLDQRAALLRPFSETKTLGLWDVKCTVKGGGVTGQVDAIRLGISRALQNWEPGLRPPLREAGFLTRDSRIVERKKPGKAKARKSFQWVKR